ncbi:hypothetical protein ACS0TY_033441 [Phlomoides rotata]
MSSSDDEEEQVPENVSGYQFLSSSEDAVSFTVLPLEWNEGVTRDGKSRQIFLRGQTDNGLRKIYKHVTAWKFDLSCQKPEISVLSAEGHWIKLLKPWNPYNDIIRTILVTLHLLHFVRWNPQQSQKALWDHLNRTFSFERKPCVDDLVDHLPLINEAVKRDKKLANSKILSTILAEKPWERKSSIQGVKPSFIVDDVNENDDQADDETDENGDTESDENDCFDHMCAICDNGGDVIICDGKCMRSFHATSDDGEDSACESLALTPEELQAIQNVPYICENCKYKEHQCFACQKLGSSDDSSPEVFCCVNGTCGYFYHPHCVAKLLHPGNRAAAEELKLRIAAGEQFVCPSHTCHVCKEVEVKSVIDLQFAVCRRCPRAYHRKCLPREIMSEEDVDESGTVRAWENLIPDRILIYCLDHEIDPNISTPKRDHIIFPERGPVEPSEKKNLKKKGVSLESYAGKGVSAKPPKGVVKLSSSLVRGDLSGNRVEKSRVQASSKKKKLSTNRSSLAKSKESEIRRGDIFLGKTLFVAHGENETIQMIKPTTKRTDNSPSLDAETRSRILGLMKVASSSVTLNQVKERHASPSTHVQSNFSFNDFTLGKAEGAVQAIRAALKKMNEGCRVQDAQAVCGVDLLSQVPKWKGRLKVYLSPFLYGMRYTSFGRHFTKVDKLKEIVDILHWYVQDGDMLVDFCCGSNDFSCLMKKKLDETGKCCSFKNYDIVQAKDDFNFERRDWMGVKPDELPDGSKLVMGLNPPFGVNSVLANKFINKALEFKPKLLILIVPQKTKRLDEKEPRYDLIWEDDQMFVGKSFYLPGSVDVNDNQIEDWNKDPPPLFLWSRPDWTPKHRAIAEQHGHSSGTLKNYRPDNKSHNEKHSPNSAQESHVPTDKSSVKHGEDLCVDEPQNLQPKDTVATTTSPKECLPRDVNESGGSKTHTPAKDHPELKSKDFGRRGKKNRRSPEDKSYFGRKGKKNRRLMEDRSSTKFSGARHLSPNMPDQRLMEDRSSNKLSGPRHLSPNMPDHETRSQVHTERGDYQHFSRRSNSTYQPYSQTEFNPIKEMDDLVSRYHLNGEESMTSSSSRPDYSFGASADQWAGPFDDRANNFAEPSPWSQRADYPAYTVPSFLPPYGEMGTSAMQRYAPRLDEMNHARVSNVVPGPPAHATGAIYHPPPPQGSLGFAPHPYHHSFSQQNSSGWLND